MLYECKVCTDGAHLQACTIILQLWIAAQSSSEIANAALAILVLQGHAHLSWNGLLQGQLEPLQPVIAQITWRYSDPLLDYGEHVGVSYFAASAALTTRFHHQPWH